MWCRSTFLAISEQILQLYCTDDWTEEADHAQKLHPAQILHCVFLAHIRDGIQSGAD